MKFSKRGELGHHIYLISLLAMVFVIGIAKIITVVASVPGTAETMGAGREPMTEVLAETVASVPIVVDLTEDFTTELDPDDNATECTDMTVETVDSDALPETIESVKACADSISDESVYIVETDAYDDPAPSDYSVSPTINWTVPIMLADYERDAFAALVMLESQGESMECKLAVASVVINRMMNDNLTLHEVLYAPYQFEPAPYISSTVGNEDCYAAVDHVCQNGPTIPRYVTYFRADYFFDFAIPYIVIDHTYFSYTQYEWERVNNGSY